MRCGLGLGLGLGAGWDDQTSTEHCMRQAAQDFWHNTADCPHTAAYVTQHALVGKATFSRYPIAQRYDTCRPLPCDAMESWQHQQHQPHTPRTPPNLNAEHNTLCTHKSLAQHSVQQVCRIFALRPT